MNKLPLLSLAALAAALPAQVTTVSVSAATPLAAMTTIAGGNSTFLGIAQNTLIGPSPNNVFLTTSQSPTGSYTSASTICYPTLPYNEGVAVNFFERAYARGATGDVAGSSASAQQAGATFGPHAILATFSNAPGRIGKIRVSFRASAAATGSTGMLLDIGNDNSIELQSAAGVTQDFPVTLGQSGTVTVRIANECRSTGDGTSTFHSTWTELTVGFYPDLSATCTFTNYGQGCGGTSASAGEVVLGQNRVVTMLVTGCFPNSPVVAVAGTAQVNLPLLAGCTLLANALDVSLLVADGTGTATDSWTVPVTMVGRTYHQFLPIALQGNALVLTASNGIRVDCVR